MENSLHLNCATLNTVDIERRTTGNTESGRHFRRRNPRVDGNVLLGTRPPIRRWNKYDFMTQPVVSHPTNCCSHKDKVLSATEGRRDVLTEK